MAFPRKVPKKARPGGPAGAEDDMQLFTMWLLCHYLCQQRPPLGKLRPCKCSAPHALLEIPSSHWARPGCPQPRERQQEERPCGLQAGACVRQGRLEVAQLSPRPGHLREQALPWAEGSSDGLMPI